MQGFIEQIAYKLYDKMGDDISSLSIMFPSRRARLFFAEALSKVTRKPLWQPNYTSVDEVMTSISGLSQGEHIRLVVELYKVYSQYHKESFDSFYFWGEMLLADFDAVDKYLIDAKVLFSNISDLKDIDSDYSYLTADQIAVITQFWKSFGLESDFSNEKQQFINIWKTLAPIYNSYRERLMELGIAYSGMIYRRAAEVVKSGHVDASVVSKHYVIAGFNALSESEKVVFDFLKQNCKVDFFWDYDDYYVENREQEAGLFIRENIKRFPQHLSLPHSYRTFTDPKHITVVAAPSDSMQCKYVGEFLDMIYNQKGSAPDKETAVVLTDENLLLPTLYSIPQSIQNINITMGYPFRQTMVYSFVERLVELQTRKKVRKDKVLFYHSDVTGLLSHPFIVEECKMEAEQLVADIMKHQQVYVDSAKLAKDGILNTIFSSVDTWSGLSDYIISVSSIVAGKQTGDQQDEAYRIEYFTVLADQLIRLRNSLEECQVDLSFSIYVSLLRRLLQSVRIPYEGEPLAGVQVMGILETRNLDFENIVLLSVNDDSFPGNRASSSFVPYNLRFAYGMPTPTHHEGVFAYYFYRLLQRAKNIHIVYCSRSDDKSSGERSRYIHQLIYESPHKIEVKNIGVDVNLASQKAIVVDKNSETIEVLRKFLGDESTRKLSPTSFYNYLECPLKFYFRLIAGLFKDDEVVEEIDSPMFGSILHKAIELLYTPLLNKPDPNKEIAAMVATPIVEQMVEKAINEIYLNDTSVSQPDYSGNVLLVKDIVIKYLNKCVLPYDAMQKGYVITNLEKPVSCEVKFELDGKTEVVHFGGKADRVDELTDGTTRIVDYKTGAMHIKFKGLEYLFSKKSEERSSAVLQTLLYAMMASDGGRKDVQPALYYVRQMNNSDYSPLLQNTGTKCEVTRYSDYREEFETMIKTHVAEIFNPSVPFAQCEDSNVCQWCDYNQICRRK